MKMNLARLFYEIDTPPRKNRADHFWCKSRTNAVHKVGAAPKSKAHGGQNPLKRPFSDQFLGWHGFRFSSLRSLWIEPLFGVSS
jgi:hypothetical protein